MIFRTQGHLLETLDGDLAQAVMPGQLRVDERVVRIEQFKNAAILFPQVIAEERGFGFHGDRAGCA